jgi:malonate transporter and related proteins
LTNVLSLAMPFFGLIFLGFFCGKTVKSSPNGLQWMNFFIVYVALPAMMFKLISAAPFEQLGNWPFVLGTTLSTFIVFCLAFATGILTTNDIRQSTIQSVIGAYANIGYMGPGLTLAALGPSAIVPAALIFVFDNTLHFTLVPFLMAIGSGEKMKLGQTAWFVIKRVISHPFNIATVLGLLAAYTHFVPPAPVDTMLIFLKNAAAPCALFALGVTVAMRPLRSVPLEMPVLLVIKLILHPLIVWLILSWLGDFGWEWTMTAVLMAALPPALNVFVIANQYRVYVEQASAAILVGTVVSVVTVTGLLWLMGQHLLPQRFIWP